MGRAGLMGATELDDVQALLERVLPDPTGFARRLLLQVMAQLGQFAEPGAGAGEGAAYLGADAFYAAATAPDGAVSETVIAPDPPAADDAIIDTNMLLAAALGACECWGSRPGCPLCQGQGSAGWTQPDPELFEELVGPAIAKLSDIPANGHDQRGSAEADEDSDNHHTAHGGNT
jgi:hypothetical protein